MFDKKKLDLEKEQHLYEEKAKKYLDHPQQTEGLLEDAIQKANNKRGSLGEAWEKLQLLFELMKAYSKGEYREVSKKTILTIIGAILYFVSPVDVIPDVIAGLGILDDAAVIGFAFKKISKSSYSSRFGIKRVGFKKFNEFHPETSRNHYCLRSYRFW
jgi:uncharacterized membrane protein YkvA (DUF1232 family)